MYALHKVCRGDRGYLYIGASCYRVVFMKTSHTYGVTVNSSWLEVYQWTHRPKIGSYEGEINEM